eukprot:1333139-Prymnesium_polylepis.1
MASARRTMARDEIFAWQCGDCAGGPLTTRGSGSGNCGRHLRPHECRQRPIAQPIGEGVELGIEAREGQIATAQ